MSRIGKKPIPLPANGEVHRAGQHRLVEGPKGKVTAMMPAGIKLEKKDGNLLAVREKEELAAIHGLTRALVSNAVEGVTKGWTKELDIVGIGYRAELKGKDRSCSPWVTLTPSSFLCPQALTSRSIPSRRALNDQRHRPSKGRPGSCRHAFAA